MTKNANGKPKTSTVAMYLRNIPRGLRDIYKARCALLGVSMRRNILKHMRDTCRETK